MAASVPTMVRAPTRASVKLAMARPLVSTGALAGAAVWSGRLQSGQWITCPANLSSISSREPQAQVNDRDIPVPCWGCSNPCIVTVGGDGATDAIVQAPGPALTRTCCDALADR